MQAYLRILAISLCLWAVAWGQEANYLDFQSPYLGEQVLRPYLREIQVGGTTKNVYNEFFNSLVSRFSGVDVNLRYLRFTKKNKLRQHAFSASVTASFFPALAGYDLLKYQYSLWYNPKFLEPLQREFHRLYLGFNVGANLQLVEAGANVNNPVFSALDIQGGLSVLDIWQFKVRNKPMYVHLGMDLDVLGLTLFRPLYLTLAPDLLAEGLHKATGYLPVAGLFPNNYQYLRTEAKISYPFVSGKKRKRPRVWYLSLAYAFELMNSKVYKVRFAAQGHTFQIGIVRKLYD